MIRPDELAFALQTACVWEVCARKVGNVHRGAAFAETDLTHFLLSAAVAGPCLANAPVGVGAAIREAVTATRRAVGQNTNLGICLLLGPLAAADPFGRDSVAAVLSRLSRADAADVYHAIRLAAPGGLGDAPEQDVRDEPTVTLLEAMRLAADRDLIAREYANGFADVFDFGTPAFLAAFEKFGCIEAAVIDCQLRWLAAFPDSLIARKNGWPVADGVRNRAAEVLTRGGLDTPEGRATGIALDQHLRSDGNRLNPGTTADLVTACLFVALRQNKVNPSAPFRWRVEDWP